MYLFVDKLGRGSETLLEAWLEHELQEYADDAADPWLATVYYEPGTQVAPGRGWRIRIFQKDGYFRYNCEFPIEGFDPSTAFQQIIRAICAPAKSKKAKAEAVAA